MGLESIIGGLIGLGGAGAKELAVDAPARRKAKKAQSIRGLRSAFSGRNLADIPQPNTNAIGTLLQFGTAGAQFGQNINAAAQQKEFNDALTKRLKSGRDVSSQFSKPSNQLFDFRPDTIGGARSSSQDELQRILNAARIGNIG